MLETKSNLVSKGSYAFLMSRLMQSFYFVSLIIALSGCTNRDYAHLPQISHNEAPTAPAAENLAAYRIQIGDVLDIKFILNPELNETVTVRPDGMISTSVAEDLQAYNLTVKEFNQQIKKSYGRELNNPKVSTVVRSFAPTRIYVSGEVVNPGEFFVVGPTLTLSQAIARAGGVKNSGDERHVVVIRRGASEKPTMFTADYYAATQDGDVTQDARLAPFDVVHVPKSSVAETYREYQQDFQQFASPSTSISGGYTLDK